MEELCDGGPLRWRTAPDYENLCLIHNLDTLNNRRNQLCMTFFEKSVLDKSGCLHYLLPPQRDVCDRLRHQSKFYLPATRTARFSGLTCIGNMTSSYQQW